MNGNMLYDAIGEIKAEYIEDAEYEPQVRKMPKIPALAAVFIAVVMVIVPVSAEMANGYVSNLLAPLYGGAQTELVDQIGVPVGANVTLGEYNLSADAVIGDKYNIAVVYSLTRTDGGALEEGIRFGNYASTFIRGTGGGAGEARLSEDKTVLHIVYTWTSAGSLFLDRMAEVTFTDLMRFDPETQENVLLEAGEWKLKFAVRYKDAGITVPIEDTEIEDAAGKKYTVHRIVISPIGVHMDMTIPNPHGNGQEELFAFRNLSLAIVLHDGTVKKVEDLNFENHGNTNAKTYQANLGALFDEPIPLEQIEEIVVCGTGFRLTD